MSDQTPSWIAKDCLDVGLFTNQLEDMLTFWQTDVGLPFDHMLPVGGGVRQHRHDFGGAVLKLNHARDPLSPASRGGYLRLIIAKDGQTDIQDLTDPDGNHVRLVPIGQSGVEHWAIEVATASAEAFLTHYHHRLGLPRVPDQVAVRCGRSLIVGIIAPDIADETDSDEMRRTGFRYTTIQVAKVDSLHAQALEQGATEGAPPRTLGKTARISFLKDGHGNWMELSQRASITGSLDPG
ncbi:MAG: VOC family protein [Hyphomonas sp.]|nr:VOC family protein [Hyphomonas sp.]